MLLSASFLRLRTPRLFAILFFMGAGIASATPTEFYATLSAESQSASGLSKLSSDQLVQLNTSVAGELRAARQGNVRAFAGTFVGRRSEEERQSTGIDQLTETEQASLNQLVATAIAMPPAVSYPGFTYQKPDAEVEETARKLKVRGVATLTLGGGRGGSFQSAGVYTEVTDPDSKLTLGIGVETFRGSGCLVRDEYYPRGRRYYGW